ncbi:MAG: hypothetical protein U0841_23180 [Chloroflexia bacterium]
MRHTLGLRSRLFLTTIPLVLAATALLALYLLSVTRTLYMRVLRISWSGRRGWWRAPPGRTGMIAPRSRRWRWRDGGAAGKRVTIIALDGTVLGDSSADPARLENHAGRPEVQAALAGGDGIAIRHSTSIDDDLIYAAATIVRDGRTVGVARAAQPLERVNTQLAQLRFVAIVGLPERGAGGGALGAAGALHPATDQQFDGIGRCDGGGTARSPHCVARNDELGRLGLAFNRMAEEFGRDDRADLR